MSKNIQIEQVILIFMWTVALITYPIALIQGYDKKGENSGFIRANHR